MPQVAGRTNDSAGDGTTTASVLAREIIHYGLQVGMGVQSPFSRASQHCSVLERNLHVLLSPQRAHVPAPAVFMAASECCCSCTAAADVQCQQCMHVHLMEVCSGGLPFCSIGKCVCTCSDECDMPVTQAVTSGANPVSIKRGIDKTCAHLVARLQDLARDVKGSEDIRVRTWNLYILSSTMLAG